MTTPIVHDGFAVSQGTSDLVRDLHGLRRPVALLCPPVFRAFMRTHAGSLAERVVLAALIAVSDQDYISRATARELSELAGISPSTVKAALARLRARGEIALLGPVGRGHRANVYRVVLAA